jgi:hypothetical protein
VVSCGDQIWAARQIAPNTWISKGIAVLDHHVEVVVASKARRAADGAMPVRGIKWLSSVVL